MTGPEDSGREGSLSEHELAPVDHELQDEVTWGLGQTTRKTVVGLLIVLGIAVSWVGSTQFAQTTLSKSNFNAPYFTTWFTTCWMILVFPVMSLTFLSSNGWDLREFYRQSETVFGRAGLSLKSLLTLAGSFCLLWMLVNYMYLRALGSINAADVTAIFSSASAFVYIFSLLLLDEKLSLTRVSAVTLSISGIVLFGYAEGFHGGTAVGVLLSLGAAIGAALYKVLFKRQVGDATAPQVSLFLSCLGAVNMLCFWLIFEILYFTKVEDFDWFSIPWGPLCVTAVLGLLFNFLINFGIAFTFPLFISLGTVLGIPLNALVDLLYRHKEFSTYKGVAATLIITGFLLMLVPTRLEKQVTTSKE